MHSLVKPREGKTQLLEGGCTSVLMCVCVGGGCGLLFWLSNKLHNVTEMFLSWDVL